MEKILVGFITGFIIGGSFTTVLFAALLCADTDRIRIRWHRYWQAYHNRKTSRMKEDGGTLGQYYSRKYWHHCGRWFTHTAALDDIDKATRTRR